MRRKDRRKGGGWGREKGSPLPDTSSLKPLLDHRVKPHGVPPDSLCALATL